MGHLGVGAPVQEHKWVRDTPAARGSDLDAGSVHVTDPANPSDGSAICTSAARVQLSSNSLNINHAPVTSKFLGPTGPSGTQG